jgi:hypothetical protein
VFATVSLLETLLDGAEYELSATVGREPVAGAREHELGPEARLRLHGLLARCELRLARVDDARMQLDAATRLLDEHAIGGVLRGTVHEVGAELALELGDAVAFERHRAAFVECCCRFDHPALLERDRRLLERAAALGIGGKSDAGGHPWSFEEGSQKALAELSAYGTSPQAILRFLLSKSDAVNGYLHSLRADGTLRCTAAGVAEEPPGLVEKLQACLQVHAYHSQSVGTRTATLTNVWMSADGRLFQITTLSALQAGEVKPVGTLAIQVGDNPKALPGWDYLLALGSVLARPPELASSFHGPQ